MLDCFQGKIKKTIPPLKCKAWELKISKRDGCITCDRLRFRGFISDFLLNIYCVHDKIFEVESGTICLGWSHGTEAAAGVRPQLTIGVNSCYFIDHFWVLPAHQSHLIKWCLSVPLFTEVDIQQTHTNSNDNKAHYGPLTCKRMSCLGPAQPPCNPYASSCNTPRRCRDKRHCTWQIDCPCHFSWWGNEK